MHDLAHHERGRDATKLQSSTTCAVPLQCVTWLTVRVGVRLRRTGLADVTLGRLKFPQPLSSGLAAQKTGKTFRVGIFVWAFFPSEGVPQLIHAW